MLLSISAMGLRRDYHQVFLAKRNVPKSPNCLIIQPDTWMCSYKTLQFFLTSIIVDAFFHFSLFLFCVCVVEALKVSSVSSESNHRPLEYSN